MAFFVVGDKPLLLFLFVLFLTEDFIAMLLPASI